MTGLILCGGSSSRMGSDKGLLSSDGITWAELACNKLSPFVSTVVISVNKEQYPLYLTHFAGQQLVIDDKQLLVGGPLHGLLSVHRQVPQEDIFLFACDLVFMEPIVFKELLSAHEKAARYEAFVFMQQREAEPLCGIYTAAGLTKILNAYYAGTLGKQSMKHILESMNTLSLPLPAEWNLYFKNINTRGDLDK